MIFDSAHNQDSFAKLRETLEEACARIELGDMYTLISVPHIHQVHVIYRSRLLDLDFAPNIQGTGA